MTLARRITGLCFALWFTFVVAEPIPFHECAMHNLLLLMRGADPAEQEGIAQQSKAPRVTERLLECESMSSVYHAPAPSSSQNQHQPSSREHGEQGTHQCACIGCSAGTAPGTLSPLANHVPIPAQLAQVGVLHPGVVSTVTTPKFILPPSTAPPV